MKRFSLLVSAVLAIALAAPSPNATAAIPLAAAGAATRRDSITDAADRGRILGKETAPLWFVMVSDFQCPFCKAWHDSTYKMIQRDYVATGKLRMAFINFPLHTNSLPAAVTAMCAAVQGKFWGVHDRIFDSQIAWKTLKNPRPYLDSLAVASGADAAKLRACEDSKSVEPLIAADQARFQKAGVSGTPTFYVGGATLVGALPTRDFRRVLDSLLAVHRKAN
ncbi:MAG TPA: thioredoxin domain-containing protein [Gemmatimonadaceae bacterium]|jgi:protein-disulfide isomerase|nr:thioredoxin domain-containing protein [Gemmatimonadaceae bacterium]